MALFCELAGQPFLAMQSLHDVASEHSAGCLQDVYACGLVMWELLTHKLPFEGENHFQVGPLVHSSYQPAWDTGEPVFLAQLARSRQARSICNILDASLAQLIKLITSGGRPPIPEPTKLPGSEAGGQFDGLDDYIALMQRCWAQTPEERPSFQEMVQLVR